MEVKEYFKEQLENNAETKYVFYMIEYPKENKFEIKKQSWDSMDTFPDNLEFVRMSNKYPCFKDMELDGSGFPCFKVIG